MEDIKKIVIAKYIANIGSDKLPQTNIFTTKQFEESFNPIKKQKSESQNSFPHGLHKKLSQ